jgi:ribosome maturation protein Sdo1
MYRIDEDIKEDIAGCDYYSMFIKRAMSDLKFDGVCYVFNKEQVNEIVNYMKTKVDVEENECGFTLRIPRNKRKYVRKGDIK